MLTQATAISAANGDQADALERHVAALRRSFQRKLRHRPTLLQRELMHQAAILTAKAKQAALDPSVTLDDLVRVNGAASRARAEMLESFVRKPDPLALPSLDDLLTEV